jgi:UDP-glucose 4-epimerase
MRILVTGGAGFIGSHLCEYLIEQGHEVVCLDNLSTGRISNIAALRHHPRFQLIVADIREEALLSELIRQVDHVYHLAAAVGVRLIMEKPVETLEVNTFGTEIVLKYASKFHKKVLIASTSEVYGDHDAFPLREDSTRVYGPTTVRRWAYAASKALDEFLALAYHQERGTPVVIVRLFNIVGPRQTGRYGMVVPTFVKQALTGQSITVFGDGQQTRCFGYVTDAVEALVRLMEHPKSEGEVFNVGSDEEIRIIDLAHLVKEKTGSSSPIVFIPYDKAYGPGYEDMRRRVPDLTKIRTWIGYRPRLNIHQILDRIIDYYRRNLWD